MPKTKDYTDNIAQVLFSKGYYILVYTDGSVRILQAQCYIGSSTSERGIQSALEYIEKAYDAKSVAREIAAIKKSLKDQEAKLEELEEAAKMRDLQAQKAFEKRIGREWEKHVKKCVKKGTTITQDFIMKVSGDRLPYDMEHEDYSYTNDAGTFCLCFEGSRLSWFRTVYYYIVLNMDITWE